jgi:hypothetical protein
MSVALCVVLAAGCSVLRGGAPIEERIDLFAVLPIENEEPASATPTDGRPPLPPEAGQAVTAAVYSVLSSSPRWRFVPDLTVAQAVAELDTDGSLLARALALGRAVKADGVLFGTVSRYRQRVGSEYGAREPAAVALQLQLVSVASGTVVWSGRFDETQQPLSENLLNWWQFWRGGPRWFTAQEFTQLGVERLLDNLADRLEP